MEESNRKDSLQEAHEDAGGIIVVNEDGDGDQAQDAQIDQNHLYVAEDDKNDAADETNSANVSACADDDAENDEGPHVAELAVSTQEVIDIGSGERIVEQEEAEHSEGDKKEEEDDDAHEDEQAQQQSNE